nr:hypothetical protein [Tanacetum cinerariifolium]
MHIRNDPSFFLTNGTGAPQVPLAVPPTLSSRKAPVDKVPVLPEQHQ